MNILSRIVLFIFSLVGALLSLVLLVFLYPIPNVSRFVGELVIGRMWIELVLVIFVLGMVVFFLIILLISIFAPASARYMQMKKESGKIRISKRAIESLARNSVSDLVGGNMIEVKSKLRKNSSQVNLKLKLYLKNKANAASIAEDIQQRIKNALTVATDNAQVNIRVSILDPNNAKNKHKKQLV